MDENQRIPNATFSDITKPFVSKWYLFFISVIIFSLLGIIYIYFSAPLYKVQAKVLIKDAKKNMAASSDVPGISGIAGIGSMQANSIENELQVITSKILLKK